MRDLFRHPFNTEVTIITNHDLIAGEEGLALFDQSHKVPGSKDVLLPFESLASNNRKTRIS